MREEQRNTAYNKIINHRIEVNRMTHENELKKDFKRFEVELALEYKQYSLNDMLEAIRDLDPSFSA